MCRSPILFYVTYAKTGVTVFSTSCIEKTIDLIIFEPAEAKRASFDCFLKESLSFFERRLLNHFGCIVHSMIRTRDFLYAMLVHENRQCSGT